MGRGLEPTFAAPASAAVHHDALHAVSSEAIGELRKVFWRPALRPAVRGARRKRHERLPSVPSGFHQQIQASFLRLA
jgi:hypothetical protein